MGTSNEDPLKAAADKAGATAQELGEQAQQLYDDFAGVVRDWTLQRPFKALAVAAGAGFLIGALCGRNRTRSSYIRDDD